MIKKILNIIFLFYLFGFQILAQDAIPDKRIVSRSERRFDYKFGVINDTAGVLVSDQFYNLDGKIENKILYYENGMVYKIIKYRYDQNKLPIEKVEYFSNGKIASKTVNYHDSTGFLIACDEYYPSGDVYKHHKFVNDTLGNPVIHEIYFANGNKLSTIIISYKYDIEGKKIEEITFNELGFLISFYTFKYNKEGLLSEKKLYNNVKESISVFRFIYK